MSPEQLGPYRIERRIGRGGMGSVYEGVHAESGQRAAVKVLSASLAGEANFRDRFAVEIETLKTLKHPNIVQLYGYGEHDGCMFYSMELIDGRSLHEELRDGRRFEWREVTRFGIEICAALKHAHDHGVIHRDLKPANLMLTDEGRIKLMDFGIARLFGATQLTVAGGVIGTADYMAPEQAEGKPPTIRTDLYSLGSVLYALLAQRPPFLANSLPEVLHNLKFEEPPPLRQFALGVPLEFEELISQLLQKDPSQRVATTTVLSNRLKSMEHGLGTRVDSDQKKPVADPPSGSLTVAGNAHIERTLPVEPAGGDGPTVPMAPAGRSGSLPRDHDEVTLASDPGDLEGEEIRLQRIEDDPPTVRHFTTVDEDKRKKSDRKRKRDDDGPPLWLTVSVSAAGLIISAVVIFLVTRPPSADAIYQRVAAAAESGDPEKLAKAEDDIDRFIKSYPEDARRAEMDEYLEAIELYGQQRRFEHRANRVGGVENLDPVELAYVEAIENSRIDPERAAVKLQALIDVYGDQPEASRRDEQCVALARDHLARLQTTIDERREAHLKLIEARLAWAEERQEKDPPAAEAVWRGLIELYADKPWAADAIAQCRDQLDQAGP